VLAISTSLSAQTFNEITTIFKTNCASTYCHGSGVGNLTFTEDTEPSALYDLLVNAPSSNSWAAERNMPLVDPGHPNNSFLYQKIDKGLHEDALPLIAGAAMPMGGDLPLHEVELVRQWILYGAKEQTTDVDPSILEEYYAGNGIPPVEAPEPPAEGEGFQLHFGTLFLEPEEEKEWIFKETLDNEALEIYKIDLVMSSDYSHHFLFFQSPDDINQPEGVVEVGFFGGGQAVTSDNKMVGGWAYAAELKLPEGTAYSWEENSTVKYNLHIKNYSTTSILPCDVYLNVYTQEPGTAIKEMHSDFFINGNFADYNIPPNEEHVISHSVPNGGIFGGESFEAPPAGEPDEIHLWLFGGHTHQWGTDYDAWVKNPDGSVGEQIYEGFYNVDYSFNQGFYDYAEPATRIFDPMVTIDRSAGLYTEAKYMNESGSNVQLGLTTDDEMQGFFVQYLVGDISVLPDPVASGIDDRIDSDLFRIYPNPSNGLVQIQLYDNSQIAQIKVYNAMGKQVRFDTLNQGTLDLRNLANGLYVIEVQQGNQMHKRKVIKQ